MHMYSHSLQSLQCTCILTHYNHTNAIFLLYGTIMIVGADDLDDGDEGDDDSLGGADD